MSNVGKNLMCVLEVSGEMAEEAGRKAQKLGGSLRRFQSSSREVGSQATLALSWFASNSLLTGW